MKRRDDVNKLYNYSNVIQSIMKCMFICNLISSLVACMLKNTTIITVAVITQIIVSIIYVVLGLVDDNFFWYSAEKARRQTSIENGMGIEVTEYKTKKYYNNSLSASSMKFSINAFESILFSKTTAEKMILKEFIKAVVAVVIFICTCIVYKNYSVMLIICQTVFSSYFIEEFITLIMYKLKLEKLYEDFYKELITIGIHDESQKLLLLAYAIEYETIKSHYKVRLSENEFYKHNEDTSSKWEKIYKKIKYEGK